MTQPLGAGHRSSAHFSASHPPADTRQANPAQPESKSGRLSTPDAPSAPLKPLALFTIEEGSPGAKMLRHAQLVHGKLGSLCDSLRQNPLADAAPGFERLTQLLRGPDIADFDLDAILRHLFDPAKPLALLQLSQGLRGICQALGGTAMKPAHRQALFERGIVAFRALPTTTVPQARHMIQCVEDLVATLFEHAVAPPQRHAFAQEVYHRIAKPDAQLASHVTLSVWRHLSLMLHPQQASLEAVLATASQLAQAQASFSNEFTSSAFIPVADRIKGNAGSPAEAGRWIHSTMAVLLLDTEWPGFTEVRQATAGFVMALIEAPRIVQALGGLLALAEQLHPTNFHSLVQGVTETVWKCLPQVRRQVLKGAVDELCAPELPPNQALICLSGLLFGARQLADVPMVAARMADLAQRGTTTPEFMENAGAIWRLTWLGHASEAQALAAMLTELPKVGGATGDALAAFKRGMGSSGKAQAEATETKSAPTPWTPGATDEPGDSRWGRKRNG
jgi:hypothetical protein